MIRLKDIVAHAFMENDLDKFQKYDAKMLEQLVVFYDTIDNISQLRTEIDEHVSSISDSTEKSHTISSFQILDYVLQRMVMESIKNEKLDDFFRDILTKDSPLLKQFKMSYNKKLEDRIRHLQKMYSILNKMEFSILNTDYDINLRSLNIEKNTKLVPVITFYFRNNSGAINADCSLKDIDYMIKKLSKVKELAKKLGDVTGD